MKYLRQILPNIYAVAAPIIIFTFLSAGFSSAQNGWYLNAGLQTAGGRYVNSSYDNIFSVYGGLGYTNGKFGISFSVPLIGNKSNVISQSGSMMLPIGSSGTSGNYGNVNMQTGGSSGKVMMDNKNTTPAVTGSHSLNWTMGDLYFYSDYELVSQSDFFSDIILNAQVKLPAASANSSIGTGKTDFGFSLTARKSFGSFVAMTDIGYLYIGNPSGITYENPLTYSIGIGKFFNNEKYSMLLYYSAYTTVVEGFEAPRQIALGLNYKLNNTIILTGIGAAGLSNFSPAFDFSLGFRSKL